MVMKILTVYSFLMTSLLIVAAILQIGEEKPASTATPEKALRVILIYLLPILILALNAMV